MALIIAQSGLVCGKGNMPCVDVSKLGHIYFSVITSGLNGCTPAALKAALTLSEMNACRNAHPKTPAKSPLPTPTICKSYKLMYLLTKFLLHLCETDHIKPLQDMCAVGWVPKNNNVIIPCIFQGLQSVM